MSDENNSPARFAEIASYPYPTDPELAILRIELAAAGIPFFEKDSQTLWVDPLLSNAIGGVKIVVDQADELAAHEVLAETRKRLGTEPEQKTSGESAIWWLWAAIGGLLLWLFWRAFFR